MKRRLFVGSSREGLKIAKQVQVLLKQELDGWLEISLWNDGSIFNSQKSFLDCLVKASQRFDYGIFIATADDIALIRKFWKRIPRDNVVFEMGLFVGSLGLKRAFLLVDERCKLPSDFTGISVSRFTSKRVNRENFKTILSELNETKDTYALRVIPSAALALGYYENFIVPFCKSRKLDNFELKILITHDLNHIQHQSLEYKRLNPSSEISVYQDNTRPIVFQEIENQSKYWDFPTTLLTLDKLIRKVVPSNEIGTSPEIKEWINYELRNFKGSLEVLIKENTLSRNKVIVEWYQN